VERAQGLVRTTVRGDVHADPLVTEDLAQLLARRLGLPSAALGQRQGMVGFTLVDGVINIAR
jgi:hypothetical protein